MSTMTCPRCDLPTNGVHDCTTRRCARHPYAGQCGTLDRAELRGAKEGAVKLGIIPPGWNACPRHGDPFPPTQQACPTCFAERRLALKLAALRVGLHRDKPTRRKIRKCKVDGCTTYVTKRRRYCREHVEQMRLAAAAKSQSAQAAKRKAQRHEQMRVWVLLAGVKVRLAEAARALGVSVSTVSRALKYGRSRMITVDEHKNIEKAHGIEARKAD